MTYVVVFDIDGTVANLSHRLHYVRTKPKNWEAFNSLMHLDTVYSDMRTMYYIMIDMYHVVFASGRGEEQRSVTETWLEDNGFDSYLKLYMRPARDYRPDHIIKEELLANMRADGFEPWIVFDDRNQVVDMWRRNGIRCLQVAPGDF